VYILFIERFIQVNNPANSLRGKGARQREIDRSRRGENAPGPSGSARIDGAACDLSIRAYFLPPLASHCHRETRPVRAAFGYPAS